MEPTKDNPQPNPHADNPAPNAVADQLQRAYEQSTPQVSQTHAYQHAPAATKPVSQSDPGQGPSVAELKKQLLAEVAGANKTKTWERWRPLISAVLVGLSYLAITYNEVAIAQVKQYISPGAALTTPVIVDPTSEVAIGKDPKVVIPKINVDIPVVYDVTTFDEIAIQNGLERGVVHYGNTALPGQVGNNVIVGHSSNNFFNSGKYKFAFVLLSRLEEDDNIILHYKGTRYIYRVFNKKVIAADDFSLVQPTNKPVVTLITCDPPGTSWRRLVVQAEQVSPDPSGAEQSGTRLPENIDTPIPGNAPSIWQRVGELF
jgi:sortase A